MIKGLKDADDEGQKAAYALNYLGIKAKDLQGHFRDPAQIVEELAVKLSKYGDSGNKVALVQDALGKGAERYIPLLKDIARRPTTTPAPRRRRRKPPRRPRRTSTGSSCRWSSRGARW
jgi:hypothetical protein